MSINPLCVDLCCGLGGVAEGFLAAGYDVVGYDITDHGYPGKLIIQDVRQVDSIVAPWKGVDITVLWASPPCDEVARFRQPWLRRKGNLQVPDLSIFEACFELKRRLRPGVFILENVRSAQYFIGQATVAREPYYFWGDAVLIPQVKTRQKQSWGSRQKMERAKIPFDLAYGLALACRGG